MTPHESSQLVPHPAGQQFNALLCREIRTSLTLVMAHIDLLRELDLGDQGRCSLTAMASAVARLGRLVDTMG